MPDADADAAERLSGEALADLPDEAGVRIVAVTAQDGESGTQVIERARAGLRSDVSSEV